MQSAALIIDALSGLQIALQWGGIMFTILSVAGLQYLSQLNARDGEAGQVWIGCAAGWSGFKRSVSSGQKRDEIIVVCTCVQTQFI